MSINDHKDTLWTVPVGTAIVPMLVPQLTNARLQACPTAAVAKNQSRGTLLDTEFRPRPGL